jgi:uncharacterized membrane protein YjfL (UPF0719 family)
MLNGSLALALIVKLDELLPVLISALVFVFIGLAVFGIAFFVIVKVSPFSVRKEIEDDQNTALGIVIGSVILGVAIIIAAAIHG